MTNTSENIYLEIIKILISAITPFIALYTALKVVDRKEQINKNKNDFAYCVDIIYFHQEILHHNLDYKKSKFFDYLVKDLTKIPYFIQDDIIKLKLYYYSNEIILTESYQSYYNEFIHELECKEKYPKKTKEEIHHLELENYERINKKFNEKINNIVNKIYAKRKRIAKKLKIDK